jgi:hypothetical protein
LVTHGPPRDVMDDYSTIPFETLCAEVAKLRLEIRSGQMLEFRQVVGGACDSACDSPEGDTKKPPKLSILGALMNEGVKGNRAVGTDTFSQTFAGNPAREFESEPARADANRRSADVAVTTVTGHVDAALADACASWANRHDAAELRKRLTAILYSLEAEDEGGEP